ncbi:MAG: hypothetical protein WD100_09320, partial [Tistlia sp.]
MRLKAHREAANNCALQYNGRLTRRQARARAPRAARIARIVFCRQAIPFLQALSPDLIVNGK